MTADGVYCVMYYSLVVIGDRLAYNKYIHTSLMKRICPMSVNNYTRTVYATIISDILELKSKL